MPDRLPKANSSLQKTDPNLKNYAQTIHDGLASVAGLAQFPTPPVILVTFQSHITDFQNKMTAAADFGKKNVTAKDAARVIVENDIRRLVRYITQVAQGDGATYDDIRAIIAISNAEVSVIPTPVGDISAPTLKFVQSVAPGALKFILQFGTQKVKSVVVEYKLPSETDFKTFVSTSTRGSLTGLTSGLTYQVRFYGVGVKGTAINYSTLDNYVII